MNKFTISIKKQITIFVILLFYFAIHMMIIKGYPIIADAIKEAKQIVKLIGDEDFKKYSTSFVYDNVGDEIFTLRGEKDIRYVKSNEMKGVIGQAFISIEDRNFYEHSGFNWKGIGRAALQLFQDGGQVTQGGSSITQQLAKIMYLSNERTWTRKIKEVVITREIEKRFNKEEILEYYINNVYYGNGAYGIGTAAYEYFSKDIEELTLGEIAFLVAIPNNPSLYDPYKKKENTIGRKNRILESMLEEGYITQEQFRKAYKEEIELVKGEDSKSYDARRGFIIQNVAEIFMEMKGFKIQNTFTSNSEKAKYEREYNRYYKQIVEELNRGGYRIYTSFDSDLQEDMQAAINNRLSGDNTVSEEGIYTYQGAAVTVNQQTGEIVAMVGGRNSEKADYLNRAYRIWRQNGSTMKPIAVYAPAFDQGKYYPSTIVNDGDIANGPKNSTGYFGDITIRKATEISSNTVAHKVFTDITANVGISYLLDMGFTHLVEEDYQPSTALGGLTYGTNVVEVAGAYSTLANDGKYNKPVAVTKIEDRTGKTIYTHKPTNKQVFKSESAYMMTDVLKGVATAGTAKQFALNNGIEVAVKTGTTNNKYDSWFAGYSPKYTTVVWTGYDKPKSIVNTLRTGQIWQDVMNSAHENEQNLKFTIPDSVQEVYVDKNGLQVPSEKYGTREVFPASLKLEKNDAIYRKDKVDSTINTIIDKITGRDKKKDKNKDKKKKNQDD
ncbi:MAG: transglycosylase domain-containing protein [Bacillaceae bacterium]